MIIFLSIDGFNIVSNRIKKPFDIYLYKCPKSDVIKYVGCSLNVKLRLSMAQKESCEKGEWLRKLKKEGLTPKVEIIHRCGSFTEACDKEQFYISKYRKTILNRKKLSRYFYNY